MQPIKQIEHRGFQINIQVDTCPESPREWDNLGTFYSTDRNINFDNKRIDDLPSEYLNDDGTVNLTKLGKNYLFGFVRCYEHSGIALYFDRNAGRITDWDTRYIGIYAVSKEDVIKCYGGKIITQKKKELALQVLAGEISTYEDYVNGNVYGWEVNTPEGDSCWGYYGDEGIEDAIECAKDSIDSYLSRHSVELEAEEYVNLRNDLIETATRIRKTYTLLAEKFGEGDSDYDKYLGRIDELQEILSDVAAAIDDSSDKLMAVAI